jgi:C-terminal peptidase prc
MKLRTTCLKSALALLTLTTLSTSFAQSIDKSRVDWTYNDHWENTQISFEKQIYGTINQTTCTKSVKELLGCMAVLNKSYELMYPDQKLLVTYDQTTEDETAPFKVVEYLDINSEDFFKVKQEYFKSLYDRFSNEDSLKLVNFNSKVILDSFTESQVTEANDQMMAGQLYNEYLALAFDPHTYIQPTSYLQDRSRPAVKRKGIGIYFHVEPINGIDSYVLDEIIPNSPAEKYGLKVGDVILKANEAETSESVYEVIKSQNLITFKIKRGKRVVTINLEKGFYKVEQVQSSVLSRDDKKYGYKTACDKIKAAGTDMLSKGIEGLILDLRNNGGGLVTQMRCISNLYLEDGSRNWAVKYLEQNIDSLIESKARFTDNIFGNMHTVTLINGNSASASEATAMYLKDYRKSFIVGERSYGKGSMQGVGPTSENPAISKGSTRALYYGPKGLSPQVTGVSPDIQAFPKITQTDPTPFKRESDNYLFVIENTITPSEVEELDRKEEVKMIKSCLKTNNIVQKRFNESSDIKRTIFDNQLETALGTIECANENVAIYKSIDIPIVEGVTFIDEWEFRMRSLRKLKPMPIRLPVKAPVRIKPLDKTKKPKLPTDLD